MCVFMTDILAGISLFTECYSSSNSRLKYPFVAGSATSSIERIGFSSTGFGCITKPSVSFSSIRVDSSFAEGSKDNLFICKVVKLLKLRAAECPTLRRYF